VPGRNPGGRWFKSFRPDYSFRGLTLRFSIFVDSAVDGFVEGQILRALGHIQISTANISGAFIASRILKIDSDGKVVGSFTGPQPGEGPHFDPHEIALGPDGSIFTAEVVGWRAEKLRPH
jgi:hypothetical protein